MTQQRVFNIHAFLFIAALTLSGCSKVTFQDISGRAENRQSLSDQEDQQVFERTTEVSQIASGGSFSGVDDSSIQIESTSGMVVAEVEVDTTATVHSRTGFWATLYSYLVP